MDKKAAIKAYAIVAILLVSVSGVALAPFLATAVYSDPSGDEKSITTNCYDNHGTSLEATKTATGYCEQSVCYDWSISKSVTPDSATIDQTETAKFQYTLTIERSESLTEKCGVRGYIWVKNTGEHATQNLKIVDSVQSKVGSGSFQTFKTVNVDTSAKPILQAGEEYRYNYDISFTPVDGACYRNSVLVTITNHGSNMGCPIGPNPKADFSLPKAPSVTYCDETATIVDDLVIPAGYKLVSTDAPAQWNVNGPGVLKFNVTIRNVDAIPDTVAKMTNEVKLTEDDTKVCRKATASVELTGGEIYVPPNPDVNVDKVGPKCAMPGEIITWTIYVNNTGNVYLDKVLIVDDLVGYSNQIVLPVGGSYKFDVSKRVPLDFNGKYMVNTVNVTAVLEKDLIVQDSNSVPICYPSLTVEKVAMMDMTAPGHYANWTIYVNNTGDVDMKNVAVYDDMFAKSPIYVDVEAGKSVQIKVSMTVPADSKLDKVCNAVKVEWYYEIPAFDDEEPMQKVVLSDDASSCIPVVRAEIDITKTANKELVCVGDEISWTVVVTNTGNYDLKNIKVTDSLVGDLGIIDLKAGASESFMFKTVAPKDVAFVENTAYVTVDVFGDKHCVLEDKASDSVKIGHPSVSVYKVGPTQGLYPGDAFTYTIYVENTGDVPLVGVKVTDILIGLNQMVDLAVGENKTITKNWAIPANYASEKYCNEVYVEGSWCHCEVSDSSEWCITVLHMPDQPCISIEKHGPCRAMVGETVPYIIIVTNTGNVPLTNVMVSDDIGADGVDVVWFTYEGTLMPGETWKIDTSATIPEKFASPYFINVVEVFGQYDGKNVWCIDSHAIDIIHPSFTIVKSAPKLSALGHDITYTLWVNNTGDVDLINIVIIDDKAPEVQFKIDYLAMGASAKLTYMWVVPMNYQPDEVCNDARGSAYPGPSAYWCGCGESCPWFENTNFGREVKAESNKVCTFIVKPGIDVEKTGPEMAKIGQTIQYNITVKNTGNYKIENVTVSDPMLKFSEQISLAKGESKSFLIDWYLSEEWVMKYINEKYYVCNVANATGDTFNDKHCVVYDEDMWCVFIGAPSIDIIKKGPAEAFAGEVIEFNLTVTNDGNLPLYNVNVTDPLLGADWYHYIGYMAVGAVVQFNVSYTIPDPFEGNSFKNVATVTGDDVTDTTVNDTDNHTVFVAKPGIEVYKCWEPTMTALGHWVNWSIEVRNTGNVNLTGVYVWDPLTGESWKVDMLNKSESKFLTAHYLVTKNSPLNKTDFLCNEVFAEGYYKTRYVSDSDCDCVFVAMPSFEVTKCGPEYVCYGDCIEWKIEVKNTGNVDLKNVTITDPLTKQSWKDVCIEIGKSWTMTVSYCTDGDDLSKCLTVPSDYVNNTVYVVADTFDDGHCILEDSAYSNVFVVRPDVEVEKSGPDVAVAGQKIEYTITIQNDGNVDLNVHIVDALLKVDEYVFVAKGGTEVKTYYYDVPLCNPGTVISNTVCVTGAWTVCNKCYDQDQDSWNVKILTESIKILKTGPESAQVGETITFHFKVWNDGQVDLSNVYVYDPFMNEVKWDYTEGDGILSPDEVWEFDVQYTIPADYLDGASCGELNNYACAHGSYGGVSTTWGDGWAVYVYDPACQDLKAS